MMLVVVLHFISDLDFILLLFFICRCSSFTFAFRHHPSPFSVDYRRVFTPILYFQLSPSQSDLRHFHFQPFRYLIAVRRYGFGWAFFYPHAFFALCSFAGILACICQDLPGGQQLFLGVSRASEWSLAHRPGPSVCLVYINPQSYSERFSFKFYHILS